ncbi:MAG: SPFH domain-containing protein [Anaerolineae bacterium]|nr:SPFH domain-containing protein [Anaerolineae bacterium]
MKRLWTISRKVLSLEFTPDNHSTPVLRWGRYHHALKPGFNWVIPIIEQALPPLKTGLYVGNFAFEEVLSRDNIPFKIKMTVMFSFNPWTIDKSVAAQLMRGGESLLRTIAHEFANRRLRRLVAAYGAEELSRHEIVTAIETSLNGDLTQEMRGLGLKPLPNEESGVMLKEIVAPDTFKRTMMEVKHNEAILDILSSYPVPELVQLLIQLIFANNLKDQPNAVSLMMAGPHGLPLPYLPIQNRE